MPQAKLRIPVDTSRVSMITTGGTERVRDGEVATVKETGEIKFRVYVIATFPGSPVPQTWPVDVIGDPGSLPLGAPVKCVNLEARPWEMPDSQNPGRTITGTTFAADRVELVAAPSNSHRQPAGDKEAVKP
jgi:hypothetical protein